MHYNKNNKNNAKKQKPILQGHMPPNSHSLNPPIAENDVNIKGSVGHTLYCFTCLKHI